MMHREDIIQYLTGTYNKQELAHLLAVAVDTGELPVILDDPMPIHPKRRRGRPTREEQIGKYARLRKAIAEAYPEPVDVASLARKAGLTRKHTASLQSGLAFLNTLSNEHGEWFVKRPLTFRGRLTPVWRAILDLHFYKLMLDYPGKRLPLYRQHSWLWGVPLRPDPAFLSRRDSAERARVFSPEFIALRRQAGWEEPEAPVHPMPETEWPCTEDCPVNRAWGGSLITTVAMIRGVVIGTLPWLKTDRIYITASDATGALKQIIGLE